MKNNQRIINYDINSKFNDDLPFLRIFVVIIIPGGTYYLIQVNYLIKTLLVTIFSG
jgi:hypothetical protein